MLNQILKANMYPTIISYGTATWLFFPSPQVSDRMSGRVSDFLRCPVSWLSTDMHVGFVALRTTRRMRVVYLLCSFRAQIQFVS